ncbi:MAG: ABC transporter substrate-binding protein [Armatimonadota bacterium]|nr:ABC transporter substrate-binding protein [Armatimonadota bacterium]MDR5675399.1 ABC transporter substrate-binding protein [Armatimonadota bacterium]MDR5689430.1 ABC transporter substrate-binding protein [Armatimonadota bacterium]MDR7386727.1 ABC transporter substrate-binding protein [Armatimonadota bacterium]MDR7390092.1 ABC transporter substrate-binding protein [Armatimonadota bacterium]
MAAALTLSLAAGPYDRTEPLRDGTVRPEGIDLVYVPLEEPPEAFLRGLAGEFDAFEFSCSLYFSRHAAGDFPFVALPVFPSRMFRHGYAFVREGSGIREPKDLEGKRVGIPEFSQTGLVWLRGILQDDYGVDLRSVVWVVGEANRPGRRSASIVGRPSGEGWKLEAAPEGYSLDRMLVEGLLDAYMGAVRPNSFGVDLRIRRLFPNYREVERAYYLRTGIFPIMHTVVVREELVQRHPWVATSLYKAFCQAKDLAFRRMAHSPSLRYALPWLHADLEEARELFGPDPWPYGLEPNRTVLQTLVRYLREQGLLTGELVLEEAFARVNVFEGQ